MLTNADLLEPENRPDPYTAGTLGVRLPLRTARNSQPENRLGTGTPVQKVTPES